MNKNIRRNVSPYIALAFIMIVVYLVTGGFGKKSKYDRLKIGKYDIIVWCTKEENNE